LKFFRFYLNSIKQSNYNDEDRILLVDDQEINLVTIKSKIEKFLIGLKCDIARNANDAIRMIKKYNYRLILMDVQMSSINGVSATKIIKNYNKDIVVIALTSLSRKSFLKEVLNESDINYFDSYISKSAGDNILFRGISKWIQGFKDDFFYLGERREYIKNLQDKKLILADDQLVSRVVIKKFLEDVGLIVIEAKDGEELLEIYRNSLDNNKKSDIDIIVTDINMPRIKGNEVAKIIRGLECFNDINYHQEIPIIALSGDGEKEDIVQFLDSKMTDYFIKGEDSELLIKIISNYLIKRDVILFNDLSTNIKSFKDIKNILLPNDIKIFNENALSCFTESEKRNILHLFIKESSESLEKIVKSNINQNVKEILFYIHSIKGISKNIGAEKLFYNIRAIESLLKNDKILEDWLETITASHQEFVDEISTFLNL